MCDVDAGVSDSESEEEEEDGLSVGDGGEERLAGVMVASESDELACSSEDSSAMTGRVELEGSDSAVELAAEVSVSRGQ